MKTFLKQQYTALTALMVVFVSLAVIAAVTSDSVVRNFDREAYQQYLNEKAACLDDLITDSELLKIERL